MLLAACLIAAGWVRSFYVSDELAINDYTVGKAVVSSPDGIRFETRYYLDGYFPHRGYSSVVHLTIPYLSLVGGLLLLSAWLFLSKPQSAPNPRPVVGSEPQ